MNPWPDDYAEPPAARGAHDAWRRLSGLELDHMRWNHDSRLLAHYLHWLTEELAGLQKVCDEQAAELAGIERCDQCDGGFW